jgi:hypothetical protein
MKKKNVQLKYLDGENNTVWYVFNFYKIDHKNYIVESYDQFPFFLLNL